MRTLGGHRWSRQAALPTAAVNAFLLLLVVLPLPAGAAPSGSSQAIQDSEVILILELDGDTVSDSFVAVERSGRIFVPVCPVAEAVSLAINCTDDRA